MDLSVIVRGVVTLGACCCVPAFADIFSHTSANGAVTLSNVPTDRQFAVLVSEGAEDFVPEPPAAEPPKLTTPANKGQFERMVDQTANAYGLESALLHAVISVESRYDANAVSPAGAVGLMQLMPDTAKRYKVADALDPQQNLHGGARYLRDLLRLFNSDLSLVLAAYNAGENRVIRSGYRIPQLKQTLDYVPRVLGFYRRYLGKTHPAATLPRLPAQLCQFGKEDARCRIIPAAVAACC